MSCGRSVDVTLAENKQLRSEPNGEERIYWSGRLDFSARALFVRSIISRVSLATVRFVGRASLDGVDYYLGYSGSDTLAFDYIDGLAAGRSTLGPFSFQYMGTAEEHTGFFEIGILVKGTGATEGTATLSAMATLDEIVAQSIDLTPDTNTLANVSLPTLIPGADTVNTQGCGKVRIEIKFADTVGQVLSLYLATGPSPTDIYPDLLSKIDVAAAYKRASFVVDAPDAWSTVYYLVGTTTSNAVSGLRLVRIP